MADDERTPDSTPDSTPPPPAEGGSEHPEPDEGATTTGWTPIAPPGKPDGEVDTRPS